MGICIGSLVGAMVSGLLAVLVARIALPEIDPRDLANLIGLAALGGAVAGAAFTRWRAKRKPTAVEDARR